MRRVVFIIPLIIFVLSACGENTTPTPIPLPTDESLPVIQLDVEHMLNPTQAYEIPSAPGFVLDATGFEFGVADGPTTVQIRLDERIYTSAWTGGERTQIIRAASLQPPAGFRPLSVFEPGKQLIVAVGRMVDDRFEPLWVAVVNVR